MRKPGIAKTGAAATGLSGDRQVGSVYTPPAIARQMVWACLDRWEELNSTEVAGAAAQRSGRVCRILDPACGDGAFLLEIFDQLCRRAATCSGNERRVEGKKAAAPNLQIVNEQLFGADIDPGAIAALRSNLRERLASAGCNVAEARRAIERNIRCGDSLIGPDFGAEREGSDAVPTKTSDPAGLGPVRASTIDWGSDFPAAKAAGGFDIVIGNPPYLREKNAKPLFDALACSSLGRRWREARMDLWYYFVHRGLDLLRPGGLLSFIVSSYWMASRSAHRMIARLERETQIEEMILFDRAPIFRGIAGRHMIFRLRKAGLPINVVSRKSDNGAAGCRVIIHGSAEESFRLPHADLFQQGRFVVARPESAQDVLGGAQKLGELFDTRQGMAENPPVVNLRLHRELGGRVPIGTGVFVLRDEELAALALSPAESALLRPYFDTAAVGRYQLPNGPTHQVVYLAPGTADEIHDLPNIAAHLARFRTILERRRETREGNRPWWQLHWPREERIFLAPRVLCAQMGARPQFVFAEQPTFVGFSINLILPKSDSDCMLEALTGILNSGLAAAWFDRHAKRRGKNLEINGHVLREFPLPARNREIEGQIGELVRQRQTANLGPGRAGALERELEELVRRLYSLESRL